MWEKGNCCSSSGPYVGLLLAARGYLQALWENPPSGHLNDYYSGLSLELSEVFGVLYEGHLFTCNIDEFKFLKLNLHSGTRFCNMLFLNRQCSRKGNPVYFVCPKPES